MKLVRFALAALLLTVAGVACSSDVTGPESTRPLLEESDTTSTQLPAGQGTYGSPG